MGRVMKRFVLMVVVPAVALLGGGYIYLKSGRYVETDNAYVKADKVQVSTEVAGQVNEVFVRENQSVNAGQLLFSLDPAPYRMAVNQARANLEKVRTDLLEKKAAYLKAEAMLRLAETHREFADKEQRRQQNLKNEHYTSDSDFDNAEQNRRLAEVGVEMQKAELARMAAVLGGSLESPIEDHPYYLAALAALEKAELDLAHTEIHASLDGQVSAPPKRGQYLMPGKAAMTLVASGSLWIEANYTEKELTWVRPGQPVTVELDIYPNTVWEGEVESMSPATASEFSLLPAQNATGNWVKVAQRVPVRIRINSQPGQPPLRAGLSAIPEIDTGHHHSLLGMTL